MILYELTGTEDDEIYRTLEYLNTDRQLHFLESMVSVALRTQRPFLSQALIKALNYHAIACLHVNAGEYRPCEVTVGSYHPPAHYRVQALMDDFVNLVNRHWENADPFVISAYVLWKLNQIHPFINGNGENGARLLLFCTLHQIRGMDKWKKRYCRNFYASTGINTFQLFNTRII